jgi:hypothetical protein
VSASNVGWLEFRGVASAMDRSLFSPMWDIILEPPGVIIKTFYLSSARFL